jgi:hypothetical protein
MSGVDASPDQVVVSTQMGRSPRTPWRVGSRCAHGYPTTIVSPALLDDSTPFPTLAWLTCPWLSERAARAESAGEIDRWSADIAVDEALSAALVEADGELRRRRAEESGGSDACSAVGIAGQRDPLGIKCLHAHVALALVGISDPIGRALLDAGPRTCDSGQCRETAAETEGEL